MLHIFDKIYFRETLACRYKCRNFDQEVTFEKKTKGYCWHIGTSAANLRTELDRISLQLIVKSIIQINDLIALDMCFNLIKMIFCK